MDNFLNTENHNELIQIMNELINTLRNMNQSYFISKHLREVTDWHSFLVNHNDIEELQSLETEIADRYVFEYDVLADDSKEEKTRHYLIRKLLERFGVYLH